MGFLTLSASLKRVLSLSVYFPVSILTFFCCLDFFFLNALLSVTFLGRLFKAISVDPFFSVTFDVEKSPVSINKLKLVSLRLLVSSPLLSNFLLSEVCFSLNFFHFLFLLFDSSFFNCCVFSALIHIHDGNYLDGIL